MASLRTHRPAPAHNSSLAGHELLRLYLKSFYCLENCPPLSAGPTPLIRARKAATRPNRGRR
jgi:hypothetical protein